MTGPLRHVAPAGAPIRAIDLVRWARLALFGGDVSATLEGRIRDRFHVRHVFLTSTGRAGMTILLKALRTLTSEPRSEVVLPSYTCYSVAASVVKAGLTPRVVDIAPETLDYDLDALRATDFSRVLAVVATNLYGLPSDLPAIARVARERGAFVIDDAAQAMGAGADGRACGTRGDAGLFSFDKGKNVAAIDGGVIVTDSDAVARALASEMRTVDRAPMSASMVGTLKALAYFVFLRPTLYVIPSRIPQLELGRTVFTTAFPLERPGHALTALALVMLDRLEAFTTARRANATRLRQSLRDLQGVRIPDVTPNTTPAYLRLPILIEDPDQRPRVLEALQAAGIGATGSYPRAILDIQELDGSCAKGPAASGGRHVASCIVTLPTHPFVSAADISRMVSAVAATALGAADAPRVPSSGGTVPLARSR